MKFSTVRADYKGPKRLMKKSDSSYIFARRRMRLLEIELYLVYRTGISRQAVSALLKTADSRSEQNKIGR